MAAFTPRELGPFMLHWRTKLLNQPDVRARTIVIDGVVSGYVSSFFAEGLQLVCYWLARDRWGKGVASRALTEFLASVDNLGSRRVLEWKKCGTALLIDLGAASSRPTMFGEGSAEGRFQLTGRLGYMRLMNSQIFREYDVRGLVDKDLTDSVVEDLGKGLGTMVKRAGGTTVVVGRDARLSGQRFRDAFIKGATSTGMHVIDVGIVPTPIVYFAANTLPVEGLAMITGSHNPPEYNGFKMGVGKTTFYGETIQELRKLIEKGDFEKGTPGKVSEFDAVTPYLHFVLSTVKRGPRKLKVVVDAGNGVGGLVAVPLLERLGYDVVPLYCEPDGTFPNHHADPTVAKNLELCIAKVKETKADLGVAFDGDADRIGVVTAEGEILWGDKLMILLSRAVLAAVPGAAIVGEVKCSFTMYEDIKAHGGKPIMWKAGHSLIKAKMKETHAALAGEMSGHIFYKDRFFGFDDAPYTAARLLEILSNEKRSLTELLSDVPVTYSSPELRFDTVEEKKFALVERCTQKLRAKGLELITVDGVRATWPDGWGLIRASNTTPILVVRYEAKTEARLAEIQLLIDGTIHEAKQELGG